MAKNRTKRFPKEAAGPVEAETPRKSVVEVVNGARESLFELSIAAGLQVVEARLEGDRVELSGARGVHERDRNTDRNAGVAAPAGVLVGQAVAAPEAGSAEPFVRAASAFSNQLRDQLALHSVGQIGAGLRQGAREHRNIGV